MNQVQAPSTVARTWLLTGTQFSIIQRSASGTYELRIGQFDAKFWEPFL